MSGVRTTIDASRLAHMVSRPGIDPRVWLTLAIVTDVGFDSETGVYADVQFSPDGTEETCLIGSEYAGNGFGIFIPPQVDDIVLVAIPMGDPGFGPIIIKRLFTGSEKPPSEFQSTTSTDSTEATSNPTVRVEDGKTFRWVLKNGANFKIEIEGSGKVEIAATGSAQVSISSESAVILNSPDVRLGPSAGQALARVGDLVAIPISIPAPVSATISAVGQIVSGQSAVKA